MNDRYLYKAKRIDNGEWEIGSLIILPNGDCEIGNRCSNPPDSDPMWKKCIITHKVDPSTICQCAGLKDKNGKMIWEKDIVRAEREEGFYECAIIEYRISHTMSGFRMNPLKDWKYTSFDEVEVIGNIFDGGSENIGKGAKEN